MPEHYTKAQLECTAYCGRCRKFTQHRVDAGRRGPCLECLGFIIGDCQFEKQPNCFHCDRPLPHESKTETHGDVVIVLCPACRCMTPFRIDHDAAMSKKQLTAKKKRERERQQPQLFGDK